MNAFLTSNTAFSAVSDSIAEGAMLPGERDVSLEPGGFESNRSTAQASSLYFVESTADRTIEDIENIIEGDRIDVGMAFDNGIADGVDDLTGADVTASLAFSGVGSDWILDVESGQIESVMASDAIAQTSFSEPRSLIRNSSFENGLADWSGFTGQERISLTESFTGSGSLELLGAGSGIDQLVDSRPGDTYQLSGFAKTTSDSHSDFGINFFDANYNLLSRLESGSIDSTSWQQYEMSGIAPIGTESVQVWAYRDGAAGSTFIDALTLAISGSELSDSELSDNELFDGSLPDNESPDNAQFDSGLPEDALVIDDVSQPDFQSLDIDAINEVSVYLLGGQSNMAGLAPSSELPLELAEPFPAVQIWQEDIQSFSDLRPGFANDIGSAAQFGPELAFGREISRFADGNVYLIKYAQGSTSLAEDWRPDGDNNMEYDTFVDRVDDALGYLDSQNINYDVEGMLWMQGEFDAFVPEYANAYEANLTAFIADMRSRYGADMEFAIGRLQDPYATTLKGAQDAVAAADSRNVIVNTDDFEILPDGTHYSPQGQLDLGSGFADVLK